MRKKNYITTNLKNVNCIKKKFKLIVKLFKQNVFFYFKLNISKVQIKVINISHLSSFSYKVKRYFYTILYKNTFIPTILYKKQIYYKLLT